MSGLKFWRLLRLACLTGALVALAGCSSLQIDVDVYKGPLSNEREIQVRQYVALARSAKPVLVMLRKELDVPDDDDRERAALVDALRGLICFYDPHVPGGPTCDRKPTVEQVNALQAALVNLRKELPKCGQGNTDALPGTAGDRWTDLGRATVGLDLLHDRWLETLSHYNMDMQRCEVVLAERQLTDALIVFAERMLYVVNNGQLFAGRADQERSVLQTLGNTILVHANDLRRQAVHQQRQQDAFERELKATTLSNNVRPPAQVVPEILRALDAAVATAKDKAVKDSKDVQDARAALRQAQTDLARAKETERSSQAAATAWDQEGLRAAYALLVDAEAKLKFGPLTTGVLAIDNTAAKKDKQAIDALFTGPGAPAQLSGVTYSARVREWIRTQDLAPELKTERLMRLRRIVQQLDNGRLGLATLPERKTSDLLAAVRQQLDQRKTDAEKDWERVDAERKTAADQVAPAAQKVTAEQGKLQAATKAAEDSAPVKTASDAKTAAAALTETLLKQADSTGMNSPESVRGAWLAALEASRAGKNEAQNLVISAAVRTVRGATLSPGFPFKSSDYSATPPGQRAREPHELGQTRPQSVAVLDDVISLLRNRRVRALAEGQKTEADNLQAAIDAAYEQRASLIYIRPAADYLKNVYSATAYQDENASPNRNMLLDYLRRLGPDGKLPQARKQLEKVFWQNINRVSVSGGGATNYVLAKDDVGNWYIKAYSSDTKMIFQSARNLFLFNSGRKLDVNLLERAQLRERASDKGLSEAERTAAAQQLSDKERAPSPAALDFVKRGQDRFLGTYLGDAQRHASDLNIELLRWPASLKAAWSEVLKGMEAAKASVAVDALHAKATELHTSGLSKTTQELAAAADAKDADGSAQDRANNAAKVVVEALDAGRRYRQQLVAAQQSLKLTDVTPELSGKLLGVTQRVLRETLTSTVDKRLKAAADYTDSLTTLGDIAAGN